MAQTSSKISSFDQFNHFNDSLMLPTTVENGEHNPRHAHLRTAACGYVIATKLGDHCRMVQLERSQTCEGFAQNAHCCPSSQTKDLLRGKRWHFATVLLPTYVQMAQKYSPRLRLSGVENLGVLLSGSREY